MSNLEQSLRKALGEVVCEWAASTCRIVENHIKMDELYEDLRKQHGTSPEDPREAALWAVRICIKEFETAKRLPEHWR